MPRAPSPWNTIRRLTPTVCSVEAHSCDVDGDWLGEVDGSAVDDESSQGAGRRRATDDRAVLDRERAAVARAVDGVGDRGDRAARVGADRGEPLELALGRLGDHHLAAWPGSARRRPARRRHWRSRHRPSSGGSWSLGCRSGAEPRTAGACPSARSCGWCRSAASGSSLAAGGQHRQRDTDRRGAGQGTASADSGPFHLTLHRCRG